MCAPLLLLLHLPIHSAKATHGPRPPPADPPSPLVVTQPQVPLLDPCTCRATRPRARLHRLLRRQPGQRPRLRRGRRPGRPRLCSRRRHPRLVRALPSLCACIDTLLTLLAPRTHAAAEGRQASWARSRLARSTMAEKCTASFPPRCVPFALITYTLSPARPGKSLARDSLPAALTPSALVAAVPRAGSPQPRSVPTKRTRDHRAEHARAQKAQWVGILPRDSERALTLACLLAPSGRLERGLHWVAGRVRHPGGGALVLTSLDAWANARPGLTGRRFDRSRK